MLDIRKIQPDCRPAAEAAKRLVSISCDQLDAVLFDMDGVVTKTAVVHRLAWQKTFDEFLQEHSPGQFQPFSEADYLNYVDGKSRKDGIKSFLASRHIQLPEGKPSDQPGFSSVFALGNMKNHRFGEFLHKRGVEAYETTVALIRSLKAHHFKIAVITASKNGEAVLQAAKLAHLFDVKIDGVQAEELGLQSKPHPDSFLAAARQLGVPPARAAVIEDASAGVEAGHAGGFKLVIGVARADNAAALEEHGADVVVLDLAQVKVLGDAQQSPGMALADLDVTDEHWVLKYDNFAPASEGAREALCALGNGYFSSRAAAPESHADAVHYPGTYLSGGYNRLSSQLAGKRWEREELVNLPNWLFITFAIDDGPWFDLAQAKLLSYEQRLNLKEGVLYRRLKVEDEEGRITSLSQRWFVHMRHFHLAAIETTITAENWSGTVRVLSGIDGRVVNAGTPIDPHLNTKHLCPVNSSTDGLLAQLEMKTSQSQLAVAFSTLLRFRLNGETIEPQPNDTVQGDYVAQEVKVAVSQADTVTVEKIAALHSSRDSAISQPAFASRQAVESSGSFAGLLDEQIEVWRNLWRQFDLFVETSEPYSKVIPSLLLHLNSFHALQTASPNTADLDVGVPARGWTGEGYEGHIFWDDLFIFPFINLRMPHVTQALLRYRYRRLDEARKIAAESGARGARFPWQSGSDGREETPKYLWIKDKQIWVEDRSHLQIHVNAAIAYNIWQFYEVTADLDFMHAVGGEMLLEIARFFASFARYDPKRDRYEIHGVVGPDEFHTAYPDSQQPGIDNNAYTNLMAVWTLCRALDLLKIMPADHREHLSRRLKLTAHETAQWDKISRRMFVPFCDNGIISQFEGYEHLGELLADGGKSLDMQRVDRLLQEQNGDLNQYKVSKQADVLMLFYVFSIEELKELFDRLGYQFSIDLIPRCIDYYMPRTVNSSTLSRVAHGWVLSRLDRLRSWPVLDKICWIEGKVEAEQTSGAFDVFMQALGTDFFDTPHSTHEGVHMASMAGTIDIVQRCYTGIVTRGDVLWLNPRLPDGLICLSFSLHYRGQALNIEITQQTLRIIAHHSSARSIKIGFGGVVHMLDAGGTLVVDLNEKRS